MNYVKILAGTAAALAMVQAQVAFAQAPKLPCVKQADLADAVVYAMPSVIGAFQAKCGATLPADGFMKKQGAQLSANYAARQTASWPGAQRLLVQFTSSGAERSQDGVADMIASLPGDALRPFVDALIQQEVSKKIPLKDCSNIERGISYLAPLPPENMGGLVSFIVRMADVKKPNLCENPAP